MKRILRQLLCRLALSIAGLYACVYLLQSTRNSTGTDEPLKRQLDLAITAYGGHLAKSLANYSTTPQERRENIKNIQERLICYVSHGTWRTEGRGKLRYQPDKKCIPEKWTSVEHLNLKQITDLLCVQLSGKNILLVGTQAFYHAHTLWLQALAKRDGMAYFCKGAKHCGHHFVCRIPPDKELFSDLQYNPGLEPIFKQSNWSNLTRISFALSDTLYPINGDIGPVIDPKTGVQMQNSNWFPGSQRAQVLILNKGSKPAPAWTFDGGMGNWSFAHELPQALIGPHERSLTASIVNAALHAVSQSYFPELLHTLNVLHQVSQSQNIFIGSWYQQPTCTNGGLAPRFRTTKLVWAEYVKDGQDAVDPWSLYYNTQIYILDRLLPDILPYFNVAFIPMTISLASDSHRLQKNLEHRKDCLRPGSDHPVGGAIQMVLIRSLEYFLSANSFQEF